MVALEVANQLVQDGVSVEVVDLRSLRSLDRETICASVRKTSRAVVLEGDWLTYGVGAELAVTVQEGAFDHLDAPVRRVAAAEIPLPYAKPLELAALPTAADLIKVIGEVLHATKVPRLEAEVPDVLTPRLSDTMTEGIVLQWLKHEGDPVRRGDVLAEIETDKATMELEAYDRGVLTLIIAAPGSTVPIAVIGDDGGESGEGGGRAQPPEVPAAVSPTVIATARPAAAPDPAGNGLAATRSAARTSPLARALARKHGLDITRIPGSGPGGRVVRADVEAAVGARVRSGMAAAAAAEPGAARVQNDQQVPLTSVRRITARRLTESAAAPHFYLTSVVDAESLLTLRTQVNEQLADADSEVSVTDLLVRACAIALRAHPEVNASWAGGHLVRHGEINVGVAVALDDGLIVPVIRDADRKRLSEIATEAHTLAQRARAGKLTPDEFSHGTFTISNLGMFGIDHFTAVINPPEAAILAVGAAREEAAVRGGQVIAGVTMKLTLSIDHRVLDGATAATFLRDLVGLVERPLRVLA